jgi:serine protease Do
VRKFLLVLVLAVLTACSSAPLPPVAKPPRALVVQDIMSKTVALMNPRSGALCAGVWISRTLVLTANHCTRDVEVGGNVYVRMRGVSMSKESALLTRFSDHDLAILDVADPPSHGVATTAALPAQGDTVYAAGHPLGLEWSFSLGEVAAVRDGETILNGDVEMTLIQSTVPISGGNSGGGLWDEDGRLLGIASFMVRPSLGSNLGFFIPVQYAKL